MLIISIICIVRLVIGVFNKSKNIMSVDGLMDVAICLSGIVVGAFVIKTMQGPSVWNFWLLIFFKQV